MNLNMLLWVTSKCNLRCKLCMADYSMQCMKDYEMSLEEVHYFIDSTIRRNIHYDFITLTGGEVSTWPNLKEAVTLIYNAKIANNIGLITNGTAPEKIFEIAHLLSVYAVSATQAPKDHLTLFENSGHNIVYNWVSHKPVPITPMDKALPAICCNRLDWLNNPTNQLHYAQGKVYYCCYVIDISNIVPITQDLVCSFEDDFISYFIDKVYDKEICRYCLCNEKVWNQLL